jgi:hypothetical protein
MLQDQGATTTTPSTPQCILCSRPCECAYGHSPSPVSSTGRACNACNAAHVIPARLRLVNSTMMSASDDGGRRQDDVDVATGRGGRLFVYEEQPFAWEREAMGQGGLFMIYPAFHFDNPRTITVRREYPVAREHDAKRWLQREMDQYRANRETWGGGPDWFHAPSAADFLRQVDERMQIYAERHDQVADMPTLAQASDSDDEAL